MCRVQHPIQLHRGRQLVASGRGGQPEGVAGQHNYCQTGGTTTGQTDGTGTNQTSGTGTV